MEHRFLRVSQYADRQLSGHGRETLEKFRERIIILKIREELLDADSRSGEDGGAAENVGSMVMRSFVSSPATPNQGSGSAGDIGLRSKDDLLLSHRQRDNVAVFDAVPSNVLDCGGQLVPFDVITLHPGADFRVEIQAAVTANRKRR